VELEAIEGAPPEGGGEAGDSDDGTGEAGTELEEINDLEAVELEEIVEEGDKAS